METTLVEYEDTPPSLFLLFLKAELNRVGTPYSSCPHFRFVRIKDPKMDGNLKKNARCRPIVSLRNLSDSWQNVNRAYKLCFPLHD